MAKKKTQKSGVTIKTVKPKVLKAPFFEYKGVQIPRGMKFTKERFWKTFQGKLRFDINQFWEAYQEYLK